MCAEQACLSISTMDCMMWFDISLFIVTGLLKYSWNMLFHVYFTTGLLNDIKIYYNNIV